MTAVSSAGSSAQLQALTVWQPWAWAIVAGHKEVENRTWAPPRWVVGGWLAIHAGATVEAGAVADLDLDIEEPSSLPTRAIVGVVRVVGYVKEMGGRIEGGPEAESLAAAVRQSPWYLGPVGWLLADAVAIDPMPMKGAQGLWPVPEGMLAELRRRFRAARKAGRGA